MDTHTAKISLHRAITDLADAYMRGIVDRSTAEERAKANDEVDRKIDLLVLAAKQEGSHEENARMVALHDESKKLIPVDWQGPIDAILSLAKWFAYRPEHWRECAASVARKLREDADIIVRQMHEIDALKAAAKSDQEEEGHA